VASRGLSAVKADDRLGPVGLAIGVFGPFAVAALLVPFRGPVVTENVALVFVVVVVLSAACGGRRAGVVAAVVSAMSYDFFFTRPYGSLKIDRAEDAFTALLLLGIGFVVAELVIATRRSKEASARVHADMRRLNEIAGRVSAGADAKDVLQFVQAELVALLLLRDCRFEEPPFDVAFPSLERRGAIEGGRRRWVGGEFTLPAEGVEVLVIGRGRLFGRFVLIPDWDVGVSIEDRVLAVGLVDQVGAALAAEPWPRRTELSGT